MASARLLVPVAALLIGGCRSAFGGEEDPGRQQFRAAKAQWEAAGVTSYSFIVANSCFCAMVGKEVQVRVDDGVITSLTLVEDSTPVPAQYVSQYRTLDALFDLIEDALNRDAVYLEVQYDFAYGFPLQGYIDYSARTVDEEFGWAIDTFLPGT